MIVKSRLLEYMGYALRADEQWAALMEAEGKRTSHPNFSRASRYTIQISSYLHGLSGTFTAWLRLVAKRVNG